MKRTPQQRAMKWQREADEILADLRTSADPEMRKEFRRAIKCQRESLAAHEQACNDPECKLIVGIRFVLAGLLLCNAAVQPQEDHS